MNDTARLRDAWDILDRTACFRPESIAIVDTTAAKHVTLTYVQLHRRAANLANFLRRRGVGRGDMVAVMLHNCRQARLWRHNPYEGCDRSMTHRLQRCRFTHTQVVELHFAAAALHAVVVNINTSLVAR
jgi:acyl-CoA synthetase (AMP-forming)/AMP-acid ligase II